MAQLTAVTPPGPPVRSGLTAIATARPRARVASRRAFAIASFVLLFLLPSCGAIGFFGFWASDQYVSEARFTIRPAAAPGVSMADIPTTLIVQDTLVAMTYLQSRALVERLERDVDLRRLYGGDAIDWFDRLKPKAEVEQVLRYWRSMSAVSVQATNGIVTLTVRAFTPGDAAVIAETCLKGAEAEINRLDAESVSSTLSAVATARKEAETRLTAARAELEATRNAEALIDSDETTTMLTALITSVRNDYLKLQQQYDLQSRYLTQNTPQIRNITVKLEAAKHEIARLEGQLTAQQRDPASRPALSDSLARMEYAALRSRAAEVQYASAIAQAEAAQLAAKMQPIYLEVFQHPAPAQEPKYPRRATWIGISVAAALIVWVVALSGFRRLRRRDAHA